MTRPTRAPEQKLRGIPRRLRSLHKWANGFKNNFPAQNEFEQSNYWNWKLPTDARLVEGRQSKLSVKVEVVEILLEACAHLIRAKPNWANSCRVTCWITVPNMHSSEICIFRDEDYFRSKVDHVRDESGFQEKILGRSLSAEWGFVVRTGLAEIGTHWHYEGEEDGWGAYSSDHWMYGEVDV